MSTFIGRCISESAYWQRGSPTFRYESRSAWSVPRDCHDYHNLFQRSRGLAGVDDARHGDLELSKSFPREELFGLTSQLRKAAVSIPSNIGEGARRKRRRVTLNHYDIALGSQGEVEVQLEVAKRLGFCSASDYARLQERVERVGKMLNELITSPTRGALELVPVHSRITVNHQPPTTNH